jgi:hypothetical protein
LGRQTILKGFDMTVLRTLLAATLALGAAASAMAATVSETDLGEFSSDFRAPTVIANGATTVNGVWSSGGDYDLLAFTGLKAGAQTVTLSFAPLSPIGPTDWSFSAGGTVNYKTSPFQWSAWEGITAATVGIQHWNRDKVFDYVITLGDDFAGQLYLGLFGTYGTLKYTISAPGNAAPAVTAPVQVPAAVPLPAAAPLLIAGLGALAFAARRRRRTA